MYVMLSSSVLCLYKLTTEWCKNGRRKIVQKKIKKKNTNRVLWSSQTVPWKDKRWFVVRGFWILVILTFLSSQKAVAKNNTREKNKYILRKNIKIFKKIYIYQNKPERSLSFWTLISYFVFSISPFVTRKRVKTLFLNKPFII